MKLRILFIAGLLLLSVGLYAQTPDGETPANEGMCDPLLNSATKGLYGLCVAFCEAQDCQPNFSLPDPFVGCKPSSSKILDVYNRRKGAADPEMPCIQSSGCPCWSLAELQSRRYPSVGDNHNNCQAYDPYYQKDHWKIQRSGVVDSYNTTASARDIMPAYGYGLCYLYDVCEDGNCLQTFNYFEISEEEYLNCQEQVINSGIDRGFDCWD